MMNIVNLTLLFFLVLIYSITGNTHKAELKSNKIYFSGITTAISFDMTDYCITPGQPFKQEIPFVFKQEKTDSSHEEVNSGLEILAGRHKSKSVVKCLLSMNVGPVHAHFTFNHSMSELNFAVKGNLTINGVLFKNIVLAQGSSGLANNWWFGGSSCHRVKSKSLRQNAINCTSDDKRVTWCFYRGVALGKHNKSLEVDKIHVDEKCM